MAVEVLNKDKKEITPNTKQQECIDNINGKYLVLAGPGTGKTFTVVQRIKAMLEHGIDPNKILCLTYSDAAALEMKNKLSKIMEDSVNINIYTYHSFCNEIIGENAEFFELPGDYRVVNATARSQFIKECIDEYKPVEYRNSKNDPYVYLKIISDKIGEIKKYRMTKSEYFHNIETHPDWAPRIIALKEQKEEIRNSKQTPEKIQKGLEKIENEIDNIKHNIAKAKEIWDYYELFNAKMEKEHYIDFDDMITFVLDKFETSPAFLDKIANKFDYIMVDEYQDTNNAQNQIVFNLVSALKSQNIFVVGDDDQIIYSFQGANLDTIENFLNKFPDTKVICLKENMRSTQSILDVARIISKQDDRRLEANPEFQQYGINKDLTAKNEDVKKSDKKVRWTKYQDMEQEFTDIVNEIEKFVKSDECPKDDDGNKKLSEIAILSTNHDDLAVLAEMFRDRNIPVELKDGKSIFKIKASIALLYYLQMLVNPELYSDRILKLLLLPPFSINPIDYNKIYKRISIDKTYIESMRLITDWTEPEKIEKFLAIYDYLKDFQTSETVRNIVLEVGAKTGIFDYFLTEEINRVENIAGLKKLIDEAKGFSSTHNEISLEAFVEYMEMVQNDKDLDIKTDKPPVAQNAIQLSTYHSSKGKEYEYVYMPTMQSRRWESSSKSFKPTIPVAASEYKSDDEWRLYRLSDRVKTMYVGMTRAKHALRISSFEQGNARASSSSAWIAKAKDIMEVVGTDEYTVESFYYHAAKALTKRDYDYKRDFTERVKTIIQDKTYSPTTTYSYIACPRKYLYGTILKFDARTGFADAAKYGDAVHDACHYMVQEALANKVYPSKEEFIEEFKKSLATKPLSSFQQREIFEGRGENELAEYYHHLTDTPISNIFASEFPFDIEVDGIKFHGRIDKIEKNDDGTFTILDYKTSKPLTSSKICAGGEHDDYYAQICLYKYYFEKFIDAPVRDVKFIFPIDCSVLTLTPTEDEVNAVVDKFKAAIKGIENCEFEPSYDESACQYCPYKDFCGMEVV